MLASRSASRPHRTVQPTTFADVRGVMMLTMDPPRHNALRQLVNKGFTPRQVAKLNEHIAHMARDVVDSVIEKGQCDFVNDVAGALPSYVIAELLGIPLEDGYRLYELTEIMNSGVAGDANPRATEAAIQMFAYAAELATRKRGAARRRHRNIPATSRSRRTAPPRP